MNPKLTSKSKILSSISHIFQILDYFDEVPLPDGKVYKLSGSVLSVKTDGTWVESELTVNSLLDHIDQLSRTQLRDILERSVGNASAQEWRDKILSYTK